MIRNHTSGINQKLRVSIQPNIGLEGDARRSVVGIPNTFLADEAILTMKTYSACWNVHGPGFLELRTLFDQQSRPLSKLTNKAAERVRMLGDFAIGSFGEFLHYTRLGEQSGEVPDIITLLADHETVIANYLSTYLRWRGLADPPCGFHLDIWSWRGKRGTGKTPRT